jgi:CPA2 family monovalent cation:H+ antiporter-2
MNEQIAPIRDLALVWASALFTGQLCTRLKQPVIAGYMLGGIAIGPHGLKWISQPDQIEMLAQFGVAMLLFTLGLDLSLKRIFASAKRVFAAGATQIGLTIALAGWFAHAFNLTNNPSSAFLFGCVCALSSSVVITKILIDRAESDALHGEILISLSLVQDLSLVLLIPRLPLLAQLNASAGAGTGSINFTELAISVGKALLFLGVVIFGSTKIVPRFLTHFTQFNSRELFPLTILVLCLAVALLSQILGLSLALGAFLAGIMISQSRFSHQAMHDLLPIRNIFSTIFFVSVGMLLDGHFIADNWFPVFALVIFLILGKAAIGTASAFFVTNNVRTAVLVGVGLAQIGEFSFILLTLGQNSGLISDSIYNLSLTAAVVTMIATPALMNVVPGLFLKQAQALKPAAGSAAEQLEEDKYSSRLANHVVLCGYGRIGKNLGTVLEAHGIPFLVVELNAALIEQLAVRGIPHIYGDGFSRLVLEKTNLRKASCLVLTVPDPISSTGIATIARETNPDIKIIARVHRATDISVLRAAGVNAVVQPEFEASIEITRLTLNSMQRPVAEISRALESIKSRRYSLFNTDPKDIELAEVHTHYEDDQEGIWFKVQSDLVSGKNLRELDVRRQTGATVAALKKQSKTIAYPDPEIPIDADDEIYIVGNAEQIGRFEEVFELPRFVPMSSSTSDDLSSDFKQA